MKIPEHIAAAPPSSLEYQTFDGGQSPGPYSPQSGMASVHHRGRGYGDENYPELLRERYQIDVASIEREWLRYYGPGETPPLPLKAIVTEGWASFYRTSLLVEAFARDTKAAAFRRKFPHNLPLQPHQERLAWLVLAAQTLDLNAWCSIDLFIFRVLGNTLWAKRWGRAFEREFRQYNEARNLVDVSQWRNVMDFFVVPKVPPWMRRV